MKNFEYCAYTYRHRQAIKYLIEKIIHDEELKTEMLKRAELHDIDKLVMYQVLERKDVHNIHSKTVSHHMTNDIPKSYNDYVEAILDYESAGYTKPDKPLNAYDFVIKMRTKGKFSEELCDKLLAICADLGIDRSYSVTEDIEGMNYLAQFEDVTEDMIVNELKRYFEKR